MVALVQNLTGISSGPNGSRPTRNSPTLSHATSTKPALLHKRSRQYHPNTNEFISKDPLEYVDGMSLYRGYFVPGGMDPFGRDVFVFPRNKAGEVWGDPLKYVAQFEAAMTKICPCFKYETSQATIGEFNQFIALLNHFIPLKQLEEGSFLHLSYQVGISNGAGDGLCDCLKKHAAGCRLAFDLFKSDVKVKINKSLAIGGTFAGGPGYDANGVGDLSWNPDYQGTEEQGPEAVLGHELWHAWSLVIGDGKHKYGGFWKRWNQLVLDVNGRKMQGQPIGEILAFRIENQILKELGKAARERIRRDGDHDGYKPDYKLAPCECEEVKKYFQIYGD